MVEISMHIAGTITEQILALLFFMLDSLHLFYLSPVQKIASASIHYRKQIVLLYRLSKSRYHFMQVRHIMLLLNSNVHIL